MLENVEANKLMSLSMLTNPMFKLMLLQIVVEGEWKEAMLKQSVSAAGNVSILGY